ncbi:MAG: DUF2232 domain-containing protein [Afipia sp.]|nr:DUF2232 domain-containing protein [Afipia sp.]
MMTTILIALAAGIASATMFASIVSGALASLLLFYLAPLPLMVAALGWGSTAALVGGLFASAGLAALFSFTYMAAFMLTIALPAWWLGHLALLARPMSNDPQLANMVPALDWYPVGRVLVWTVVFASITTFAALLTLGTDDTSISSGLRRGLEAVMGVRMTDSPQGDRDRVLDILVSIAPGAATIIAIVTLTLNLWLAAKITATSGRLRRPWPDLRTTMLPKTAMAALAAAIALCFAGGIVAIAAQVISSALMMVYAMTGFATLHTLMQTFSGRSFVLGSVYAATIFIGWPLIGMISLGLADAIFGIRQSYWIRRGPPTPT